VNAKDEDWDYFKIITSGLDKISFAGFCVYRSTADERANYIKNKYYVQQYSWVHHMKMMDKLKKDGALSDRVYTVKYEDLCRYPQQTLAPLFEFLELDLSPKALRFAEENLHTQSISGRPISLDHPINCDQDYIDRDNCRNWEENTIQKYMKKWGY
jgi:hypothetical protein